MCISVRSGKSDRSRSGFLLVIVCVYYLMKYIQSRKYWKYKVTFTFKI